MRVKPALQEGAADTASQRRCVRAKSAKLLDCDPLRRPRVVSLPPGRGSFCEVGVECSWALRMLHGGGKGEFF